MPNASQASTALGNLPSKIKEDRVLNSTLHRRRYERASYVMFASDEFCARDAWEVNDFTNVGIRPV
jgi:hypothetical protein